MNSYDLMHSGDPRIVFAFWLGMAVVVASVVLLAVILLMRQWAERRERLHRRAAEFWLGVLSAARQGATADIPRLERSELTGFVDAWNELHDAHDDDNPGMRRVAEQVDLEDRLVQMVERGSFHDRVMAIIAMGYLRSPTHFRDLVRLLEDRSPIVSISAARALMRIDPERAVQQVVPQIAARHDWVDGGVAQILHEVRPEVVSPELSGAVLRANDDVAPRLVRFLAGVSPEAAAPVISRILAEPHDEHLVSTCLQVMGDARDLDKVRPLLGHPRWHVRMHAASALGRLGGGGDIPVLVPALADAQWWVRYRTAQALRTLFGGDRQRFEQLRDVQEDRYARDILTQVLAEQPMEAAR